jgi:DNA (cytosine-5)-methyltransferase 1
LATIILKMKPRLLDLFCCAGGVAVGYDRAGFEVVGVDIKPQPHFPFEFICANAMTLPTDFLKSFDAIHASPPCQSYSDLAKRNGNGHEWPRLMKAKCATSRLPGRKTWCSPALNPEAADY